MFHDWSFSNWESVAVLNSCHWFGTWYLLYDLPVLFHRNTIVPLWTIIKNQQRCLSRIWFSVRSMTQRQLTALITIWKSVFFFFFTRSPPQTWFDNRPGRHISAGKDRDYPTTGKLNGGQRNTGKINKCNTKTRLECPCLCVRQGRGDEEGEVINHTMV